jgi:hypothetical protein
MSETRQAADQLQRRRTSSAAVSFRSTAARTHYRLFPCASKTTVKRAIKHIWIFIKSACALISAIICWLGLWEIFDLYLFKKTVLRDCLYVIVCAIIMGMTSTYLPNCGIYEDDKAQIDAQEAAIASADEWETTLGASPDDAFSPTMSPSPPVASGEDASSAPVGSSHGGVVAHDSDRLIEMTPSPSGVGLPVSNSDLSIDLRNQPEDVDAMLVAESRTESYSRACWFLSTQLCTLDVFVRVYCCSIVALFASIGFWVSQRHTGEQCGSG